MVKQILISSVFCFLLILNTSVTAKTLVITASQTIVRAGPNTTHQIVTLVKQGETFPMLEMRQGWYKLRLPNGREGWISSKAVRIKEAPETPQRSIVHVHPQSETDNDQSYPAASSIETEMWDLVRNTTDAETLITFINRFPDGRYTRQARSKLEQLKNSQPSPISVTTPKQNPQQVDVQSIQHSPPFEGKSHLEVRYNTHLEMQTSIGAKSAVINFEEPLDFNNLDHKKLHAALFFVTNTIRQRHGLAPLTYHALLERTAQLYAQRMVNQGFFAHEDPYDPNMHTIRQRGQHIGVLNPRLNEDIANAFGIQYQSGETVHAINRSKGIFSRTRWGAPIPKHTYLSFARSTVEQWMQSPELSRNLLSKYAVQMGAGAALYWDEGFPMFKVVQVYQYGDEVEQ